MRFACFWLRLLESEVPDVEQCALEGEADHTRRAFVRALCRQGFLAARDLSIANCPGGLGAVASDVTGFGVAWGVELLSRWMAEKPASAIRLGRRKR